MKHYSIATFGIFQSLMSVLYNWEGLWKYRDDINKLIVIWDDQLNKDIMGTLTKGIVNLEYPALDLPNGFKNGSINEDIARSGQEAMDSSLKLVQKMLKNDRLSKRQPFLYEYLRYYEIQMRRYTSDKENALDHMSDETFIISTFIFEQIEHMPTSAMLKNDPDLQPVSEKFINYFKAYNDYYDFTFRLENTSLATMAKLDENKYLNAMDKKLERLQKAGEEVASIPYETMEKFFQKTDNTTNLNQVLHGVYLSDKHHNLSTASANISLRREQLQKNMTNEEVVFLSNFSAQFDGITNDAFGADYEIKNMAEPYKGWVEEMQQLSKACKSKTEEGFQSYEEKSEFFQNLAKKSQTFLENLKNVNVNDPEFIDKIKKSMAGEDPKIIKAAVESTCFLLGDYPKMGKDNFGMMNRAIYMGEKMAFAEKSKEPEFQEKLLNYYDMMNGSWRLFGDSKEYKNMMSELKTFTELTGKKELNNMEKRALAESAQKISNACQKYLSNGRMKEQITKAGKDRFAGALGILNLVDPKKAEEIRAAASQRRRTPVSLQELEERAGVRAAFRRRKAGIVREHANVKKDANQVQAPTM